MAYPSTLDFWPKAKVLLNRKIFHSFMETDNSEFQLRANGSVEPTVGRRVFSRERLKRRRRVQATLVV